MSKKRIKMRRIIVNEFVSLDGVMEAPEKWAFQYFTDEIGAHIGSSFATSDALLLGPVTFETFAVAFSGETGGQADVMNSRHKYVVSTTMKTADWINSTLVNGDLTQEVTRLKQQPGMDIAVTGSGRLQ
jgi:dihydrofolate reductase